MKIALDAQLTIGTATGIGEYVRGLSGALRFAGNDVVDMLRPQLNPWRFDRRVLWDQVFLPRCVQMSGADVLHCASGTMPLVRIRKHDGAEMPVVVTVHDVAWLRVQTHTKWYARKYFGEFALARYRAATRIVVDSEFSRNELVQVFSLHDSSGRVPPIAVIYPGVSEEYGALERDKHTAPVIFVVGTIERRKNLAFLIRLLPRLPDVRIIAVGPFTSYADECRALATELGVADRLEMRGYVTRDDVLYLYATCSVVAVPSTYEGFGYAAAQALCAGVPVVVSDRSSLPEVVGSDAPVIPLERVDAWLETLRNALHGELDARAQAVRNDAMQRFRWQRTGEKMTRVYETL